VSATLPPTAPTTPLHLLERYAGLRAWVVGDLMLDEYVAGEVSRISPEAPVQIVRVRDTEHRLGGAANVANQLATLGAHTRLAGVLGSDATGEEVLRLCARAGIDTRAVARAAQRCTTRKLRVLGHSQQLLRLDWEDTGSCASESAEMMATLRSLEAPDVLVLSDYAKGVLDESTLAALISTYRERGVPVVVDPKHRDFTRYRGATTLTPNLKELELAWGHPLDADDIEAITRAARTLSERAALQSMVVTLGSRGMLVVPAQGTAVAVPAVQRDVYDVTGAGDTAIAVLAISLAAGASLVEAAHMANTAAGVAVGRIGAVAVDASSIREALAELPAGKVLSLDELAARAAAWRTAGKRIVFTNGCFDLLHAGHLALLHNAAALGDVLVLAINSDASVRGLKGAERPLVPQAERAALLAALSCVDAVTIFDEPTPLATLKRVRPDVLVKGADYQLDNVVGREFVESTGGRVALVPLLPEKSTTALLARIRGRQ
jgi:D-beta-D-heptose 7-phosphate kinase/D-beta-D-heptose 1-phosphate adenosyltransferase